MAALQGANDMEKLSALTRKTHKEQIVWFMNGFWDEHASKDSEIFWKWAHKLQSLDPKGIEGNEVDEFLIHRFLESFGETMTVTEMRESLRKTGGISGGTQKLFPITHFLVFRFHVDWKELVNAPQGDNKKEIEEAQRLLDEVQVALRDSEAKAAEAKASHTEAELQEKKPKPQKLMPKPQKLMPKLGKLMPELLKLMLKPVKLMLK